MRSDSTLFAILASALPFRPGTTSSHRLDDAHTFMNAAHSLAMEHVAQGDIDVSTLQTLCLIVLFDFKSKYNGSKQQPQG